MEQLEWGLKKIQQFEEKDAEHDPVSLVLSFGLAVALQIQDLFNYLIEAEWRIYAPVI